MKNKEAVQIVSGHRGDAIIVSTMTTMKWIDEVSPSDSNLGCVPFMGGASSLGLGLALARPDRKVIVLDGDGSLLMQLGSLATISDAAPANFYHVVFVNGVWFENLANIPVPSSSRTKFADMAKATGYVESHSISYASVLDERLPEIFERPGPQLIELKIMPETSALWTVDNPPPTLPEYPFVRMGEEVRKMKKLLTGSATWT